MWGTEPAGIGWAASQKKFIDKTTHVITHDIFMLKAKLFKSRNAFFHVSTY